MYNAFVDFKVLRPTKSNVDNFDNNYDFNGKVIAIGLRVKRFDNFMPRVMCVRLRPTKSNVDNCDNNYDFNGKVIAIGLRVEGSDNFMPRVMRKRLRVNFHNFDHNFAVLANREQSCQFCVI